MARRVPLEKPPTAAEVTRLDRLQKAARQRIGARIRDLRLAAGLSLRQTSIKADISPSYLSDAERGAHAFTIDFMVRMAYHLGVSLSDLISE